MKTFSRKIKVGFLALIIALSTLTSSIGVLAKNEAWNKEDFMYYKDDNSHVIGLSQSGIKKAERTKRIEFLDGTRIIGNKYVMKEYSGNDSYTASDMIAGKKLKEVVIPQSVRKIDSNTFTYCDLERIDLPLNLEEIGDWAFYSNNLKELFLPNSIRKIGLAAFRGNKLEKTNIPNQLQVLEDGVFFENNLEELDIPASVKDINGGAFYSNSLRRITAPEGIKFHNTGAGIIGNQKVEFRPKQNPFYIEKLGFNGKLGIQNYKDLIVEDDGGISFPNDDIEMVKLSFRSPEHYYNGTITIYNPHKWSGGTQTVDKETTDTGTQTDSKDNKDQSTQTDPKENKDQSSQTKVDVQIRYLFEDKSIYKEDVIQAEIGAILDGGDLPMVSDDMEFMDGFLLYEVKGDGKDLIERTVAYLKKDQETQTEEDKKDASSQTDITMKDLEDMTKVTEEYKEKIETLEKDLASTKDSDLEKRKEIKDLKDKLDKLKKELDEKTKQLDKEKDKDLVNKIKDLENKLEGLNKKLKDLGDKEDEKLKSESKDLEKKLEELEKSLKSKEEVNQIQNKTISNLDKEIKDLKAKLNLKSSEELKNNENSQLTSLIKEMEGKINELKNTSNNQASLSSSPLQASSQVKASPITEHTTSSKDSNQKPEVSGANNNSNTKESDNNEVKDVRYPNKSTPRAPVNPVETSDGKAVNTNKGVASAPSKARATIEENVDNANNEYPIHRGDSEGLDYSADARQFVSFTTKNGKSFHLIINHDEESENVMLLTEVSEDDLLNMVESKKEEKEEIPVKEEVIEKVEEEPVKEEKKSSAGTYFLLLLVVGGVIGAGYYFKVIKGKEANELEGFEEDYEEEYFDEAESYDEKDEDDELIEDEEEIDTKDLL